MSEPQALQKARCLAKHVTGSRESCAVQLTTREAWEFLKWYRTQLVDKTLFDIEVRRARAFKDPWPVLSGMTIMGFEIERSCYEGLH
jgi:hypothetical protein